MGGRLIGQHVGDDAAGHQRFQQIDGVGHHADGDRFAGVACTQRAIDRFIQ